MPNRAALALYTFRSTFPLSSGSLIHRNIAAQNVGGPNGTQASFRAVVASFEPYEGFGLGAPRGAKFGTPPVVMTDGWIATSEGGSHREGHTYTRFSSTDRYLLFRFTGGKLPYPIYGWAQLSVILPRDLAGPRVTLINWAYETSGAQLPAGVHRKAPDGSDDISAITPSSSHATTPPAPDSTGLPALALGATGVRRWRAARKAA